MIQKYPITKIEKFSYEGEVCNLHLRSNNTSQEKDDLYWIDADSGIISHNCFPKDMNALMAVCRKEGILIPTIRGAWDTNLSVRPERDWEALKGRAVTE